MEREKQRKNFRYGNGCPLWPDCLTCPIKPDCPYPIGSNRNERRKCVRRYRPQIAGKPVIISTEAKLGGMR